MYVIISINVIWGEGGILDLMVGKKAEKATINVAIFAILFLMSFIWKNIAKFIKANSHRGMKIIKRVLAGNLYIPHWNVAIWNGWGFLNLSCLVSLLISA